jgi:hypothetical protein
MTDAPNGSKSTAARFGGAVVATGPEVLLVVDRFARSYDGPIQYKWGKFAESDNSWIAGRADDVFFLDPNDVPRLHLNLRWNSLQPILKSSARTGSQAALKNAYAATITQCVWTQMLMVAVATITLDRETGDGVAASGWRGQLAKMIAGELYPDKTVGEALQILHANLRSAETAPTLIGQLGSLAHDRSSVGPLLEKAAQWMREREKPDQTDL